MRGIDGRGTWAVFYQGDGAPSGGFTQVGDREYVGFGANAYDPAVQCAVEHGGRVFVAAPDDRYTFEVVDFASDKWAGVGTLRAGAKSDLLQVEYRGQVYGVTPKPYGAGTVVIEGTLF